MRFAAFGALRDSKWTCTNLAAGPLRDQDSRGQECGLSDGAWSRDGGDDGR